MTANCELTELQKTPANPVATERETCASASERPRRQPRADIYESDERFVLRANLPGVDENSVEIVLEKDLLTIRGRAASQAPEGLTLVYSEYVAADYERSFLVSDAIDREQITARVRDGVLELTLPKAQAARVRRIPIKAS